MNLYKKAIKTIALSLCFLLCSNFVLHASYINVSHQSPFVTIPRELQVQCIAYFLKDKIKRVSDKYQYPTMLEKDEDCINTIQAGEIDTQVYRACAYYISILFSLNKDLRSIAAEALVRVFDDNPYMFANILPCIQDRGQQFYRFCKKLCLEYGYDYTKNSIDHVIAPIESLSRHIQVFKSGVHSSLYVEQLEKELCFSDNTQVKELCFGDYSGYIVDSDDTISMRLLTANQLEYVCNHQESLEIADNKKKHISLLKYLDERKDIILPNNIVSAFLHKSISLLDPQQIDCFRNITKLVFLNSYVKGLSRVVSELKALRELSLLYYTDMCVPYLQHLIEETSKTDGKIKLSSLQNIEKLQVYLKAGYKDVLKHYLKRLNSIFEKDVQTLACLKELTVNSLQDFPVVNFDQLHTLQLYYDGGSDFKDIFKNMPVLKNLIIEYIFLKKNTKFLEDIGYLKSLKSINARLISEELYQEGMLEKLYQLPLSSVTLSNFFPDDIKSSHQIVDTVRTLNIEYTDMLRWVDKLTLFNNITSLRFETCDYRKSPFVNNVTLATLQKLCFICENSFVDTSQHSIFDRTERVNLFKGFSWSLPQLKTFKVTSYDGTAQFKIPSLPDNFFSYMSNIQKCEFSFVKKLQFMPDMSVLQNVRTIALKELPALEGIDKSLYYLPKLQKIEIDSCPFLMLPYYFEKDELQKNKSLIVPSCQRVYINNIYKLDSAITNPTDFREYLCS